MAEEKPEKSKEEATPGAAEGEGAAEGGAPKSKKKLIIIGVGALLVLIFAGGGGFFLLKGHSGAPAATGEKSEKPEEKSAEKSEKSEEKVPVDKHATDSRRGKKSATDKEEVKEAGEGPVTGGQDGQPIYFDMQEFLVNLNTGGKQTSFLKLVVTLEIPDDAGRKAVEANMPRIRDSFQVYLRELRAEDLRGSAGLQLLREELLLRINKITNPAKVDDILFKEIIVQ